MQLLRTIRRHWRKGTLVGGVGCVMTLVAALQLPQSGSPKNNQTPGSFESFEDQDPVSKAARQAAADQLRDAEDKSNVATVEGQRDELEKQLVETANRLLVNQSDLAASAGKIATLQALLAAQPKTIATSEVPSPSAPVEDLKRSLYLLESQQEEFAAKMTENHPKLADVRQKVADLRKALDQQPKVRKSANDGPNPARQSLELTLRSEQSQAESLRASEQSLEARQHELRGALAALNASALEIERVQNQMMLAEANHKRDASLSLAQPTSPVAQAAGLRRSDVLFAGLLLSAGSAASTMLLAAWLNPIVTTAKQLTAVMNLPVVGVIPRESLRAA